MKKNNLVLFFILIVQFGFSQTEKVIYGKVLVKDATPQGVLVLNLVNEKETITNKQGEFSILAKPEDVLVFSAVHLDYQRKIIEQEDYDLGKINIEMTSKVNQLDEVEIINIDAVSLGILSRPAKTYTPAERRLKTAGDFKPIHLLALLGGSLELDPIINAISGRTKRLKGEIEIEKLELNLMALENLYEDEFYIKKLNIEAEYVKAFKLFLIENEEFVRMLNNNDETNIAFTTTKLSVEFNSMFANEKK